MKLTSTSPRRCRRLWQNLGVMALAGALSACGGGGGGDEAGGVPPALLSWNGNVNGSTVKDADNDTLAFTSDRTLYMKGLQFDGVTVDAEARVIWNGSAVGAVLLAAAEGGGQLAVLRCTDGSPMDLSVDGTTVSYTCVRSQGQEPPAAGESYVSWPGNAFDDAVRDSESDWYVVEQTTRQIGFIGSSADGPQLYGNAVFYANTRVDTSGAVYFDGLRVGSLTSASNSSGQTIAVFKCADGSLMSVRGSNSSDSVGTYVCTGSSSPPTSGSGGEVAFIEINGSANGICVLDASNDCFAFDAVTGQMSFLGLVQQVNVHDATQSPARTYGNARAVISGDSLRGLAIDGTYSADIRLMPGSGGPDIAVLVCFDGRPAEISADPARPGNALLGC